uniref:SHSP domain-containing protein n=1 Tax=Eptatretus burgeri TaxID=7764 RepID=A0A8C4RBD8_EPTBU
MTPLAFMHCFIMFVPIRYSRVIPTERGFGGGLDELQDELRRSERIMELLFQQAQSRIRAGGALNLLQLPGSGRETEMAGTCLAINQSDTSRYVVSLDTRQFHPEKMSVKVIGDLNSEEEVKLPRDVDPQKVTCCFTADGKLRIEAPLTKKEKQTEAINILVNKKFLFAK